MALTESLIPGTVIYCYRYFTSLPLLSELLSKNLLCTGAIQKNRINVPGKKLTSDKEFVKKPVSSEIVQSNDKNLCIVKWLDNEPVLMVSTSTSLQPEGLVRRWSKKEKKYIQVNCPAIDMSDRMISYYRTRTMTKKWTVRKSFHFFHLVVMNAWIECRDDRRQFGDRPKEIMQV